MCGVLLQVSLWSSTHPESEDMQHPCWGLPVCPDNPRGAVLSPPILTPVSVCPPLPSESPGCRGGDRRHLKFPVLNLFICSHSYQSSEGFASPSYPYRPSLMEKLRTLENRAHKDFSRVCKCLQSIWENLFLNSVPSRCSFQFWSAWGVICDYFFFHLTFHSFSSHFSKENYAFPTSSQKSYHCPWVWHSLALWTMSACQLIALHEANSIWEGILRVIWRQQEKQKQRLQR